MDNSITTVVHNIEVRRHEGPKAIVYFVNGRESGGKEFKGSTFDQKVMSINGRSAQITYVVKGRYINIQSWEVMPESQEPITVETDQNYKQDRQESIERQSAINQAINFVNLLFSHNALKGYTAKDQKDPDTVFEIVKKYAEEIKEHVQYGSWDSYLDGIPATETDQTFDE